ncbi:hypothetical protein [Derxia gummosa]|uniref:Uncharacterized protein n=1 Tax=Derxia gummosa DSM 723 TaxID=1121388 RepID=A0A9U5D043_9BURK|nr:hypothetical protein [Derxia gummosa]
MLGKHRSRGTPGVGIVRRGWRPRRQVGETVPTLETATFHETGD